MGCDSTNKSCKNIKKKITAPKDNNLNIDIKNKVDSNIKNSKTDSYNVDEKSNISWNINQIGDLNRYSEIKEFEAD